MDDKKVLSVTNLTKSYWTSLRAQKLLRVVDKLSFQLDKGEAYGLIGPNGAGKTTTVKMIVDLIEPDAGEVKLFEQNLQNNITILNKVGFMPENPAFYIHLTTKEFLSFIGNIYHIERDKIQDRIKEVIDIVGLNDAENRRIKGFSKGMKQRLGLAQAIINNPDLLILDEALDGLDPLGRTDIKKLLIKMKNAGTTILFSSHILSDVEEICDRIGIIDQGTLIKELDENELKNIGNLEAYFVKTIHSNR